MPDVSIRDLRNQGGKIVDRVEAGEEVTITCNGRPVAELRPVRRPPLDLDVLVRHRKGLPRLDVEKFRAEVDAVIDQSL